MKFGFALALAVGAVSLLGTAANASTVTFDATVSFNDTLQKITLSSNGLNNVTMTVGTPDVISNFYTVGLGTGNFTESQNPVTATFTFTLPTPSGSTAITGGTITGTEDNSAKDGSVTITWPTTPTEFDFADGTKLDVTLAGFTDNCTDGPNCLSGSPVAATFDVLNGPVATPLPATFPLFAGGLGFVGYLTRRRKKALPVAA